MDYTLTLYLTDSCTTFRSDSKTNILAVVSVYIETSPAETSISKL